MMFSAAFLAAVMPRCDGDLWAPALAGAFEEFDIVGVARIACFVGQIAHESAELTALEENLNYSGEALFRLWPSRFTPDSAQACARQPERIASTVYANRMGNGNVASGDGWTYRGRGPLQITGRDAYRACGQALGLDLEAHPEILLTPNAGARSAGWFWASRSLNALADLRDVGGITRKVNGGANGLSERIAYTDHAWALLAEGL